MKKQSTHKATAHSQRLVLESRLVFDGAIAATAVEVQPDVIDNKPITEPTSEAAPPPSEPTVDIAALEKPATVVDYQPNPDNTDHQPAFAPLATEHPFATTDLALSPVIGVGGEHATTLIVVDPRATNAANLLANPPAQTQIISLDTTRDGFQQVADLLQGRNDVTELHILPWTEGNTQWLGNKSLSSTLDPTISNELTQWGDSFADNANIVFHGTSNQSTSWLNHIDALTGANANWSQNTHFNEITRTTNLNTDTASPLFVLADTSTSYADILNTAENLVQNQLSTWFQKDDALSQLAIPFSANANTPEWTNNALALRDTILTGDYSIRLEVRSANEMNGLLGAYSPMGTTNQATIYLNAAWLSTATLHDIDAVLLEELGHSFDQHLNGVLDSQGDEGQAFASLVLYNNMALQKNDQGVINVDGQTVAIEAAAPTVSTTATKLTVIEPSSLNTAGVSSATLTGWVIADDGLISTNVTVTATVADITKGTLSSAGGGTVIAGGFQFTGTPAAAQTWVNQLVFTAANVELGVTAATTSITVQVTDGETLSASAILAVTITPSNDPVIVPDGSAAIPEGAISTVITATTLAAVDPEVTLGSQNAGQIIYRLTALPANGYLTVNGSRVGIGSIFSHANVLANQVIYVHTASGANQNTADSFSVSINDGATPQANSDTATVTLNITPVNQAPTVSGSGIIYEGQPRNAMTSGVPQSIVGNFITASGGGDPTDPIPDIKITSLPAHGTLYFNGTAVINGVSSPINRALTVADFAGTGFVITYAARSGLTYSNDGIDPSGIPPADSFNVSVTDAGGGLGAGAALTSTATIMLDIKPVNDDPIWVAPSTLTATVTANGPDGIATNGDDYRVTLTQAMIDATDVDSPNTAISYVLTQLPANGQLLLNNSVLSLGSTVTRADILSGKVQYMQTGIAAVAATDTFKFQIRDNVLSLRWDGTAGEDFERTGGVYDTAAANSPLTEKTFTLNQAVTPIVPGFTAGSGTTGTTPAPTTTLTTDYVGLDPTTGTPISALSEGGTVILTDTMLNYTATGVPASQVVYTIKSFAGVSGGWNGSLQRNGINLSTYESFTQQDVTNGLISFVHNGGEVFESSVTLQVSAGGVSGGVPLITDNVVFKFYITPINDNPTTSGSSNTLITEGATVAITTSQLSFADNDDTTSEAYYENKTNAPFIDNNFALNNGYATLAIPAPDPLQFRIAALPTAGKLQYDSTGGGNWIDITAANVTGQTLYLASDITGASGTTRLRYVHDGLEIRNDSFQAISRDRWGAESAAATVSLLITNINDAPEIAANPTLADPSAVGRAANNIGGVTANEPLIVVEEGGFFAISTAMLQAYDPDSTSQQVQYRVTTSPTQGRMAYSTDGINFQTIGVGSSFSQAEVALGRIYYVHDGSEPSSIGYPNPPDDKFFFTLADGDKEQANNEFWVYVKPTNDAPIVTAPTSPIIIDSLTPANNPVFGFSVDDVDLAIIAPVETDYLQVSVRLLQQNGTAFTALDYADVTIAVTASGATIDTDKNGTGDYLSLRGTKAQVNAALTTLTVTFANNRDNIYQVQVIADDRVRDLVTGVLVDADAGTAGTQAKANGGLLNQALILPNPPTVIPSTEYDWYSAAVPAVDPNIAAKAVTIWASNFNDPQTLTVPVAQTPYEDTAFTFSQANGNRIQIADIESSSFGLPVKLTLAVDPLKLGILSIGTQAGVTITGSGTNTVTLTGIVTDIQTLLNTGFSYTGNAQYNDTDILTVTFDENLAAVGSDVGAGSVKNPNVIQTVALDLIAVNDLPTVSAGVGVLIIPANAAVPVDGVTIADPNDLPVLQAGETDFIQVTVRLIDATLNVPVSMANVTFGYDTSVGATVDTTYTGVGTALVLRGTLAQVQNALQSSKLTVAFTGDQDATYRIQIIADDRLRDLGTGVLTANANGGAVNQLPLLPAVPSTVFAPLTDTYALIGNNTAVATRTLHVSNANDAPVNNLPTALQLTIPEDVTTLINGLSITDADDFGANLTVILTPTNGTLSFSSVTAGVTRTGTGTTASPFQLVGNKTNINLELAKLRVTPTTNLHGNSGIVSIAMQTTDTALAGTGSNLSDTDRLDITVTAVNDQPTVANSVTLAAFTEDVSNPAGTVINTLAFGYSDTTDNQTGISNAITTISGNTTETVFSYIAIVGDTNYVAAQGTWQVSTTATPNPAIAGDWITIPDNGLTTSLALIFPSDRQIRFVAALNYHGTPGTLTVRLADNSVDLSGKISTGSANTFNITLAANGNSTNATGAWNSAAPVCTIGTTVTNVNDRPTVISTSLVATTEDNANPAGATVATLFAATYKDNTDNQGANTANAWQNAGANITGGANAATNIGGIAIVGNAALATEGIWQYDTGSGWTPIPTSGLADATALILPTTASIRFLPDVLNYNGTVGALTIRAADSLQVFSASSDISATVGDQTSIWSATQTLTTSVTPQNDTPVLTGTIVANPTVTENASTLTGLSINPVNLLTSSGALTDIDLTTTTALTAGTFGAGTITVTLTDGIAGDVLFVNGGALAGINTTSGGTGNTALVITLSNSATLVQVETILAALQYQNTSDNPTLNNTDNSRSYTIVVNDGNNVQASGNAGGPTTLAVPTINGTITINPTQDPPTVDLNAGGGGDGNAVTWNEGQNVAHTPINFSPVGVLVDADNTNLVSMTLTVSNLLNGDSEIFTIGGTQFPLATNASNVVVGSFSVSYVSATGVFTLVPNSGTTLPLTTFQTLLQGMTYNNIIDNPTAGVRNVAVQIRDAGFDNLGGGSQLNSNVAVATITVVPANDQPRLTNLNPVSFNENVIQVTPAFLDSAITLIDIDSPNYTNGTITISGLVAADIVSLPLLPAATPVVGDVQWTGVNGGNVQYYDGGSWITVGTATGGIASNFVVTLNGSATAAIAQRVIENLTFKNTADAPITTRTLTYTVNDGSAGGTVLGATLAVTIIRDNDAPVMTAAIKGGTYTEQNATPLQFISGAISVSDPDSPADFFTGGAGSLTVHLDTYVTGDVLSVLAGGSIAVVGNVISYGGIDFATTSGGNGADLIITFTSATATPAAVQALLAQLTFSNTTNNDPTVGNTDPSRDFTVTLNDGANTYDAGATVSTALTATLTGTINITAINDAPLLPVFVATASYTEDATPTVLNPTLTLSDPELSNFAGGTGNWGNATLTISRNGGASAEDVFSASGTLSILIQGSTLTDGVTTIGTVTQNSAGILKITFEEDATTAQVQAALRQLAYSNTIQSLAAAATSSVTLNWVLDDGDTDADRATNPQGTGGNLSVTKSQAVTITGINDAPVLSDTALSITQTEDAIAPVGAVGTLVSTLISGVSDADTLPTTGIAITAADTTMGSWYYSTDNGSTWIVLPTVTDNNALLLTPANRLYFKPTTDVNGAINAGLTIRAWDQTTGITGTQVDASTNGGATAFSSATDTVLLTVTAVNDAPTRLLASVPLTASLEDATTPNHDTIANLFNGSGLNAAFSDATDNQTAFGSGSNANNFAGIVVVGNAATAAQGTWEYSADGSTGWTALSTTLTTATGVFLDTSYSLRFNPVANWNGIPNNLTVRLVDNSVGSLPANLAIVDVSNDTTLSGVTTRYSDNANTVTLSTSVTAVNDAPTRLNTMAVTLAAVLEDIGNAATGDTVSILFNSQFVDTTDTVAGGSSANSLAGVVIVANTANATTEGSWQYRVGAGAWTDVGAVTTASGLFVAQTDSLRFVPVANFNGTPAGLTVRLADNSTGGIPSSGASVDVSDDTSKSGVTTRYSNSSNSVALNTSVTAVNDAPTRTATTVTLAAINEDQATSATDPTVINAGNTVTNLFTSAFTDITDTVVNGSTANGLAGIVIVGNTSNPTTQGSWEYHDSTGWHSVGTVAINNGLYIAASDGLRFVPVANFNGIPTGLTVRLADNSTDTVTTGTRNIDVSIDGTDSGGTTRYSNSNNDVMLNTSVNAINDAPSIAALDATSVNLYLQSGTAVVLDANATLSDQELVTERDNWNGATLTIARQGGASADDLFGASGTSSSGLFLDANNVFVDGITIGSYSNANGTLQLTFNANATAALVNTALRGITYSNVITTAGNLSYNSVNLAVTINDQNSNVNGGGLLGNGQDQGGGGLLTAIGNIIVNINRLPIANADTISITEDISPTVSGDVTPSSSVGGNVLDTDQDGDTLTVQGVLAGTNTGPLNNANVDILINGSYGSISLAANGSYTYTLDNNNATVNGLNAGQFLLDTFTYTINDGRGGTSTTTVTVTINGVTDGTPSITPDDGNGNATGQATVNEAGLTSSGDTTETTIGTIQLIAADGISSITVGGRTVSAVDLIALNTAPVIIDTGDGILTLTGFTKTTFVGGTPIAGTLEYSYTLKTNLDHTGATESTDTIALSILNIANVSSTGTLIVRIVDDVPTANADINSVTEEGIPTITGNVVSTGAGIDRIGADTTKTPVTGISFAGSVKTLGIPFNSTYGSLRLNANGSYTYTLDNTNATVNGLNTGQILTETFSYTITDADGDTSTTTLTITINGKNDAPVAVNDTRIGVSGQPVIINVLSNDSDPENDINPATVKIVGTANAGDSLVVAGQGTWSVNPSTGAITFTPIAGFTADPTPISYTVQDKTGLTSNPATVTVDYPQTAPTAVNDSAVGVSGQATLINVLGNDSDPENDINPATVKIVGTTNVGDSLVVTGQGTWSVNPSTGAITFTPIAGFTADPTPISYTVQDKTGLTSNPATVTVDYPTIIATDIGTSGSLIMLSNPDKNGVDSYYNDEEKKWQFNQDFKLDNELPPVHLSLYVPIRNYILSLTGSLRDQVVLELERYSFNVPRWSFRHTDPNEQLEFAATRSDGSGLPQWLRFDAKTLKFSGFVPKNAHDERVMVTARDTYGNEVHTTFSVHVNRECVRNGHNPCNTLNKIFNKHRLGEKPVVVGKSGLSEQVHAAGKLSKLQESRALLDSLKQL
jgi:VCBS repeat-containing protein/CshA-type fibril repeat protein